MQAVILAAGKGTRMGELTKNTPKPMLLVAGRPFLEYVIESLPKEVDEVILVVGYLKEIIQSHFGSLYKGRKISYVVQEKQLGTGPALWQAKEILKGKFLVLMADDLYPTKNFEECLKADWAMLVSEENLVRGGKVILDENGKLRDVIEGQNHGGELALSNLGVYVLTPEIFSYELVKTQDKDEYGLPQTIVSASKDHPVTIVKATSRVSITDPSDIKKAGALIQNNLKTKAA